MICEEVWNRIICLTVIRSQRSTTFSVVGQSTLARSTFSSLVSFMISPLHYIVRTALNTLFKHLTSYFYQHFVGYVCRLTPFKSIAVRLPFRSCITHNVCACCRYRSYSYTRSRSGSSRLFHFSLNLHLLNVTILSRGRFRSRPRARRLSPALSFDATTVAALLCP